MRADRTIALVPEATADRLIKRIEEVACPEWKKQIEIWPCRLPLKSENGKRRSERDPVYRDKISRDWNEGKISLVFAHKSINVDIFSLKKEGVDIREIAEESIYREILGELQRRRLVPQDESARTMSS